MSTQTAPRRSKKGPTPWGIREVNPSPACQFALGRPSVSGTKKHKKAGEKACKECNLEYRAYFNRRRSNEELDTSVGKGRPRKTIEVEPNPQCERAMGYPSEAGRSRHLRAGEEICQECQEEYLAYQRKMNRRRYGGEESRVKTYQEWAKELAPPLPVRDILTICSGFGCLEAVEGEGLCESCQEAGHVAPPWRGGPALQFCKLTGLTWEEDCGNLAKKNGFCQEHQDQVDVPIEGNKLVPIEERNKFGRPKKTLEVEPNPQCEKAKGYPTTAGRNRHLRAGEEVCQECQEEYITYARLLRRKKKLAS